MLKISGQSTHKVDRITTGKAKIGIANYTGKETGGNYEKMS